VFTVQLKVQSILYHHNYLFLKEIGHMFRLKYIDITKLILILILACKHILQSQILIQFLSPFETYTNIQFL
jgi:hypothetical protein